MWTTGIRQNDVTVMIRAICIAAGMCCAASLPGCGSCAPKITPVAPLTLESVQPLSREAKERIVNEIWERQPTYWGDGSKDLDRTIPAQLFRLSLEGDHPVIRVVHVR